MMGIRARSILAAALAALPLALASCIIDVDALTNGQCPAPKKAFQGACVDDIDECAAGLAGCDPLATCKNTQGSFICTCPAGALDVNGDGTKCTPNGCAATPTKCDPTATCTSVADGVKCACPAGSADIHGDGTKCVTGDSCVTPIVVDPEALPAKLTGTTADGTPHYGFGPTACAGVAMSDGIPSSDKVYSFTPTATGDYLLRLTTTTFDALLYVVTDCGKIVTTCLGAVDTACVNCTESLVVKLTAGTTYSIIVDGSGTKDNHSGAYTLDVRHDTVQIDVTSLLVDDTVANDGNGEVDPLQDLVDGFHALPTQSVASKIGGPGAHGLPDDAFFPANADHSAVQLHWSNSDNGPNSRIVNTGDVFTFPVPSNHYDLLQIYGMSTNGAASMTFTLSYDDSTSDILNVTFVDWYSDPAPPGQFFLINDLDRYYPDGTLDSDHDGAVFGVNLKVDPKKTLVSVYASSIGQGTYVFYGATAQ